MPWLGFFADDEDLTILLTRLNEDTEVAFIVPIGIVGPEFSDTGAAPLQVYRRRWKALPTVCHLADGHHSLWHVPAGPLPLVPELPPEGEGLTASRKRPAVPDPWNGWVEGRQTPAFEGPYFGDAHPDIRLTLWTRSSMYTAAERAGLTMPVSYWIDRDMIVASDFQWIGSRFAPAPVTTQRWWSRLKRWMSLTATPLRTSSGNVVFWAFPSVLQKLKSGIKYSANNWNLDDGIRTAGPMKSPSGPG